MSLINQMLRDLQKQQEGERVAVAASKPSLLERLPRLPIPLLAGAGVGLLVLICWWLAGALSSWMFQYEPEPVAVEQSAELIPDSGALSPEEYAMDAGEPSADEQASVSEFVEEEPVIVEEQLSTQEVAVAAPLAPPAPEPVPVQESVATKRTTVAQKTKSPKTVAEQSPRRLAGTRKTVLYESSNPPFVRKPQPVAQRQKQALAKPLPPKLHPNQLPGAVGPGLRQPPITTPFGSAEEAYQQGRSSYQAKHNEIAIESLRRALQLYPGHMPARELLADIYSSQGQVAEAMRLLTAGLEIAPDYPPFKKRQARLLIGQSELQEAVQILLAGGMPGVEEAPEAHVLLASAYQRLGEPFLAAQTYRNLLVAWPQTGAFWIGLGGALEAESLPGEARKAYRQALATQQLSDDLTIHAVTRLEKL